MKPRSITVSNPTRGSNDSNAAIGQFKALPLRMIDLDPDQPRKEAGDLTGLKASIAEYGLLHPLIVAPGPKGRHRIIAGERRYRAAKALGMAEIPVCIRTLDEHRKLEVQLVENVCRNDLTPMEEAKALRRLIDDFHISQRELARRLGYSPARINETLRILTIPEKLVRQSPEVAKLSRSALLEMAKEQSPEKQARMAEGTEKVTTRALRQQRHGTPRSNPFVFKTQYGVVTIAPTGVNLKSSHLIEMLEDVIQQIEEQQQ